MGHGPYLPKFFGREGEDLGDGIVDGTENLTLFGDREGERDLALGEDLRGDLPGLLEFWLDL